MADLDQWYSLAALPIIGCCFYIPLAFLFRRWTGSRDAGSGQAFAYISGWSLDGAVFGLLALVLPPLRPWSWAIALIILASLFLRMGKGIWWSSGLQAAGRFAMVIIGMLIAYVPGVLLIGAITLIGALYGP